MDGILPGAGKVCVDAMSDFDGTFSSPQGSLATLLGKAYSPVDCSTATLISPLLAKRQSRPGTAEKTKKAKQARLSGRKCQGIGNVGLERNRQGKPETQE